VIKKLPFFLPPPPNLQQLKGKQSANETRKVGRRADMAVSSSNSPRHQSCNYVVGSGKEEAAFIWERAPNMKEESVRGKKRTFNMLDRN
jgi:hypothetical protein